MCYNSPLGETSENRIRLLVSWLGKTAKSLFTLLFFSFHIWTYYTRKECRKVVHRPCSRCISSVQKLNKNSIKFFLSTWMKSMVKSSQAKLLHLEGNLHYIYKSPSYGMFQQSGIGMQEEATN